MRDQQADAEETLSQVEIADVTEDSEKKEEDEQKKQDKAKFDEVMSLMNKYDQAEAHAKWVNSPEYAQQKEQDKLEEVTRKKERKEEDKKRQ